MVRPGHRPDETKEQGPLAKIRERTREQLTGLAWGEPGGEGGLPIRDRVTLARPSLEGPVKM